MKPFKLVIEVDEKQQLQVDGENLEHISPPQLDRLFHRVHRELHAKKVQRRHEQVKAQTQKGLLKSGHQERIEKKRLDKVEEDRQKRQADAANATMI